MPDAVELPRGRLVEFAADIKLSHSVFALPFAILSVFMAAEAAMPTRVPSFAQIGLIVLCMVLGRSFAMGMNRLLDANLDAHNPRTARRAIPSGRLSRHSALLILVTCALAFQTAAFGFLLLYRNPWPATLAVPVLGLLGAYPLLKRFTRLCHYYLGFCLALAPVCAWIAIAGFLAWPSLILAGAVLCWTAGFDIIYACQDVDADRAATTYSVPAALGIAGALWVARLTHVLCIALLVTLGWYHPALGTLWFVAVALVAVLFCIEHSIVTPTDLSRVNLAFFTLNGIISLCLGTFGVIDILR